MNKIKISLAQLKPKLGDKSYNLKLISDAIIQAKNDQSNLIVFPELFLTGYSVGESVSALSETGTGPIFTEIKNLCHTYGIYAVLGFVEKGNKEHHYISTALIDDRGEVLGIYRKTHLFYQEKKYFTPGSEFKVIKTSLGNIGMMICFDVEFPEVARSLKLMGADFIVISNANMHPYKDYHRQYVRCRAMENEIPVIICNRLGEEKGLKFCGDSMAIDSTGKILLEMGKKSGVMSVNIPLKQKLDPKINYTINRRRELYTYLFDIE